MLGLKLIHVSKRGPWQTVSHKFANSTSFDMGLGRFINNEHIWWEYFICMNTHEISNEINNLWHFKLDDPIKNFTMYHTWQRMCSTYVIWCYSTPKCLIYCCIIGVDMASVFINEFTMDGGYMYMITVTAWTPGSLSSTIYRVFLANLPPYNGYCDVIPTAGTTWLSYFKFHF